MKTAEEILSEHTGETGIYLTKGQIRGSDAIEAMDEYADQFTASSTKFLNGLLKRILKGEKEVIIGALRDEVISKSHIIKIFEDLRIYEEKHNF